MCYCTSAHNPSIGQNVLLYKCTPPLPYGKMCYCTSAHHPSIGQFSVVCHFVILMCKFWWVNKIWFIHHLCSLSRLRWIYIRSDNTSKTGSYLDVSMHVGQISSSEVFLHLTARCLCCGKDSNEQKRSHARNSLPGQLANLI